MGIPQFAIHRVNDYYCCWETLNTQRFLLSYGALHLDLVCLVAIVAGHACGPYRAYTVNHRASFYTHEEGGTSVLSVFSFHANTV